MGNMLESAKSFVKKEAMLVISLLAAVISLFITPPTKALLSSIDWITLATLFMLLTVLDGFKQHNLFAPLLHLASKIKSVTALSFFFVFSVFFTSMFVTNDVSLIIFVPLTIIMFRDGKKENYIIPLLVLENIAAVRGSLLTPFGSPQNLFIFGQSGLNANSFILMMLPIWLMSIVLLSAFILFIFRKDLKEQIVFDNSAVETSQFTTKGIIYLCLFVIVVATIVSRTQYWLYVALFVTVVLLVSDVKVFTRVDYVLLLTFFCFLSFLPQLLQTQ